MTEAEWLACDDPQVVLTAAGAVSGRKRRLAVCACYRRCGVSVAGGSARTWWLADLEEGLAIAEGLDEGAAARERRHEIGAGIRHRVYHSSWRVPSWVSSISAAVLMEACRPEDTVAALSACRRLSRGSDLTASRALASLLRDIFGNPFRPVTFSPEWLTDTAVALARQMYESRDYSAMPILADALQEAGCDSEEVLNHCRDTVVPHIRGCWVVDLVLGRE